MTSTARRLLRRTALSTTLAISAAASLAPVGARADEQTVKLIQLLIKKGILTPGQAGELLQETGGKVSKNRKAHPAPALPMEAEEQPPPETPGQIRVTYVPQFVRKQIADEVRAQVMDQAQAEGWAEPSTVPDWIQRVHVYGDGRFRYESDLFDSNNYNQFVNFNAINQGNGFDANSYALGTGQGPPFLNTTEDRDRFRIRFRLGAEAQIDDWVTANIRIASGSDNQPVSFNQSLGSPGDFDKYAIWLDRAYIEMTPTKDSQIYFGRFPKPFAGSDLMFYYDLEYDGIAGHYTYDVTPKVQLFANAGGFPIFNTAFDFSTYSATKYGSHDSYLTAAQGGVAWQATPNLKATFAAGIFDFLGVQGAVSSPCYPQAGPSGTFYCDTDATRTPYEQFGNSLYAIRNIVYPNGYGGANPTSPPNPEYYGLASRFNVLDLYSSFNITTYHPIDLLIEGEFMKNLAFNRNDIASHGPPGLEGPVNNIGSCNTKANPSCVGPFVGGDTGYQIRATLGYPKPQKLWDWNTFLAYRYLETDVTVDALTDSEFHQGGTNARGYIVGGSLGIARDTYMQLKWTSANTISGPHYGADILFLDLQTSF